MMSSASSARFESLPVYRFHVIAIFKRLLLIKNGCADGVLFAARNENLAKRVRIPTKFSKFSFLLICPKNFSCCFLILCMGPFLFLFFFKNTPLFYS